MSEGKVTKGEKREGRNQKTPWEYLGCDKSGCCEECIQMEGLLCLLKYNNNMNEAHFTSTAKSLNRQILWLQ